MIDKHPHQEGDHPQKKKYIIPNQSYGVRVLDLREHKLELEKPVTTATFYNLQPPPVMTDIGVPE